ncbi:MAG: sigma-70 family RNA polymerase sigma factor [Solirubrobacteraceae bacterium]
MPVSTVILPAGDIATRPDAGAGVAQLFARHQPELFRYCRSILRDPHDAEDAVQVTMLKAMLHGPQAEGELRPWLYRVAHNEAISILRARRPAEPLDDAAPAAPGELAQTVEHRVRLAAVHGDLHDLTERQRVALVLREYSGCSHEQIAGRLGVTPRAVKQLIFEARAALHACEEGRELVCADVRSMLTGSDGRVLRGRRVRAHLRTCRDCRSFRREARHSVVAPFLPLVVGGGIFARAWASVKGALVGWAGGSATGVVGTKLALTVAVVASAGGVAVVQPEFGSPPAAPGTGSAVTVSGPAHLLAPGHTPLRLAGRAEPALLRVAVGSRRSEAGVARDVTGIRAPRERGTSAPSAGSAPAPTAGGRPETAGPGTTSDPSRGATATDGATTRDPRPAGASPAVPENAAPAEPGPPASVGPPADPPGQSGAAPGPSGQAPGHAAPPAAPPADPAPPPNAPAGRPADPPAGAKAQGDPGPPPSAGQPGPPGETPGHGSRK